MSFKLFKKKHQYLALDIGSQNTKIIVFQNKKPAINKILIEPTPEGAMQAGDILNEDVLSDFVSQCVGKMELDSEFGVVINVSGKSVIAKKIDISPMEESMIPDFVEIEAEQELFYDKEEMELDYSILNGVNFKKPEAPSLFVITVLKKTIESYNNLIRKSFMNCEILDTSFTALFNSFEHNHNLDKNKKYMFLDIGCKTTELLVLIKNQLIFARSIPIGGDLFTQGIQTNMNLNYQEAEELKISASRGGEAPKELNSLILDKLNPSYCEELLSCYELYHSLFPEQNIDSIYITGGASHTLGLTSALQNTLECSIDYFDPFHKIENASTSPKKDMKSFFSVATGLAMRSIS